MFLNMNIIADKLVEKIEEKRLRTHGDRFRGL